MTTWLGDRGELQGVHCLALLRDIWMMTWLGDYMVAYNELFAVMIVLRRTVFVDAGNRVS